jgi:hypothetical protein
MVRFKNRYLTFEIVWKDGKVDEATSKSLVLLQRLVACCRLCHLATFKKPLVLVQRPASALEDNCSGLTHVRISGSAQPMLWCCSHCATASQPTLATLALAARKPACKVQDDCKAC